MPKIHWKEFAIELNLYTAAVLAPARALADHSELLLLSVCKECQLSPVESELSSLKETGRPSGLKAALLRLGW